MWFFVCYQWWLNTKKVLNLTRNAAAVVLGGEVAVVVCVDGVVVRQLDHLLESVINKDEADES